MVDLTRKVRVINRTAGATAYEIEALRVTRVWHKTGDYLNIAIDELLELRTIQGGLNMLENCLVIEDKEALSIVFDDREMPPEYSYGEKEIEMLLYRSDLEQLLDALDYAPTGALQMIRMKAGKKLPNTTAKINAINEKFGVDINKTFELFQDSGEEGSEEEVATSGRRTAPLTVESTGPKYNIVNKK